MVRGPRRSETFPSGHQESSRCTRAARSCSINKDSDSQRADRTFGPPHQGGSRATHAAHRIERRRAEWGGAFVETIRVLRSMPGHSRDVPETQTMKEPRHLPEVNPEKRYSTLRG